MNKRFKILIGDLKPSLIFSLILMMSILTGCGKESAREVEQPEMPDYYSMLRSANKLILSEMTINKMGTVDDLRPDEAQSGRQKLEACLNMVKIGTRKGVYSYNTYLRAYIDLGEMRPEDVAVDTVRRVMSIRLPEIRTEFAGRDVGIREEHYRVTGLRSNINADERARVKEAMNEALKKEVEERSSFRDRLKVTAKEKAKAYFMAFGAENGYKVEFK